MASKILQSVVEITSHHDLDSLEYAFVSSLGELVPARTITLHRLLKANEINDVEEIIQVEIKTDASGKRRHNWTQQTRITNTCERLQACLAELRTICIKTESGNVDMVVPICSDDKILGALELNGGQNVARAQELIESFAKIYGNYMRILNESERDNLTGLLNRRTFDHKLNRLLKAQRQANERGVAQAELSAWLAVLDVDHFKRVNDMYGHVYGDEILLVLSQKMRESFRKGDLLFRVGGEEFVIVLAPISSNGANRALERFRTIVSEHKFPQIGTITVSIGYAKVAQGDYPSHVFDLADKALYYAKEHGRNQVFDYQSLLANGELTEEDQTGSIELF